VVGGVGFGGGGGGQIVGHLSRVVAAGIP
jgi:hypothetical protein